MEQNKTNKPNFQDSSNHHPDHKESESQKYKYRQSELKLREPEKTYEMLLKSSTDAVIVTDLEGHITRRKWTRANLLESEAKHRAILEAIPDLMFHVNKDGIFLGTKASKEGNFHISYDNYLGKRIYEFIPSWLTELIKKKITLALETGETQIFDFEFKVKDIPRYFEARTVACMKDEVVIIVRDITERKRAEEILKRDKESFEKLINEKTRELMKIQMKLDKAKRLSDIGTLAATVAHELRNPLAAISLASYNIKKKKYNPMLDKHIVNIEKKIRESDQIINNLLFYSRIKMPQYEKINIYNIIEECISFIQKRFKKRQVFIINKCKFLHNVFIEADSLQVRELFENVLDNAYDALVGKKGKIEIRAEYDSEFINMTFSDNGVGIDKENLKKVYEPFFTTKSKGTGLGLMVCRQIVNLHEGIMDISSAKDKGTTVGVRLPVKERNR
jgi:PAS domain S-box-containing protein